MSQRSRRQTLADPGPLARRPLYFLLETAHRYSDTAAFIKTDHSKRRKFTVDQIVADLVRRAADGNDAFMNGDMQRWLSLIPLAPDYSIMTPFGGWSNTGFDASPDRLAAMSRTFTWGTTDLEVVATYACADMVVLTAIERQRAVIGGVPEQDWSLRVTLVYRRAGTEWHQVHRHADPLVKPIDLPRLSALARA